MGSTGIAAMRGFDFKSVAVLASVITLFVLGLVIVVRSGKDPLSTSAGMKQAVGNLTRSLLLASFWLAVMFFAQRLAGYNLALR